MRRFLFTCLDAGLAALILLPIFLLLDRKYFKNTRRSAWYFFLSVYLAGVYAVVGLPDVLYVRLDLNFNFIPFAYMFSDYANSLLNVLMFVPLGFFLPVLWVQFRNGFRAVFFGFSLSLAIEGLQIFTYRATDVNDLITNTTGTLVGWCIAALLIRFCPKLADEGNLKDVYTVCAVSWGTMFFLQPFLAEAAWLLLT